MEPLDASHHGYARQPFDRWDKYDRMTWRRPYIGLRCNWKIPKNCGPVFAAEYFQENYGTAVGLDHSNGLVEYARPFNGRPSRQFEAVDLSDFRPKVQFEFSFMIGVLYHLERSSTCSSKCTIGPSQVTSSLSTNRRGTTQWSGQLARFARG